MKITNLEKRYGDKIIFNKANLDLNKGDKVALLGQNGTGKTTLFKCLDGDEFFDGEINFEGNLAVMEQEKIFDKIDLTFEDYLEQKKQVIQDKISKLEEQMGLPEVYENEKRYHKVLREHEILCSRTKESKEIEKQKNILTSLGYTIEILKKPIVNLSGGQKTALRLTECLSKEADVLLLDEPTNHLDFHSISWLESKIKESNQTIIIVSHDRYFIDEIVNVVVEIENKNLIKYNTNYSKYLKEREHHRELLRKKHESIESKRDRLLESAKEKHKWAHKNGHKGMRITADRLERDANSLPETIDPETLEDRYIFSCRNGIPTGKIVFEIKNLSKSYDRNIFHNLNINIDKNDRICILGENGVGKTTLLKVMTGLIDADSGTIRKSENINIGYFDQEGENLPKNKKVVDYFLDVNDTMADHQIANLAKKFGLDHDLPKKIIKTLSGGEKARLQLMALFSGGYNVLVLDEPTNHLDLELREALEEALKKFTGAIIFVSHDRYFINRVATKIVKLKHNEIKEMDGNYSDNF